MHHSSFIASIASIARPKMYVELGLYKGETLSKVIPYVDNCIGIDMNRNESLDNLQTQYKDKLSIVYDKTDNFFVNFDKKIDMAFIDADHNAVSALRDFENVFKLLSDNGIIFMHDTDPINNDYIHPGYCGDSYKLVPLLEKRDDINVITLPILEAGLSIIMKKNSTRTFLRNGKNFYTT
jgi:predicted O-methyltransferase YrrM